MIDGNHRLWSWLPRICSHVSPFLKCGNPCQGRVPTKNNSLAGTTLPAGRFHCPLLAFCLEINVTFLYFTIDCLLSPSHKDGISNVPGLLNACIASLSSITDLCQILIKGL